MRVRASGLGVPLGMPIGGATSRAGAGQNRRQQADGEDESAKHDPAGHRPSIGLLRPRELARPEGEYLARAKPQG